MRAAAVALRRMHPAQLIVAAPIGAHETCDAFREHVDEVVCAVTPEPFLSVGAWYSDFSQTSDDEVRELLQRAAMPNAVVLP
jgi:putative phosphoribosyl transferase